MQNLWFSLSGHDYINMLKIPFSEERKSENSNFTWLINFKYDITFIPDADGREGKYSSMPPTTYVIMDAGEKISENWLTSI